MVILYLFDSVNGYRYRKVSCEYYYRIAHYPMVVCAWKVQ